MSAGTLVQRHEQQKGGGDQKTELIRVSLFSPKKSATVTLGLFLLAQSRSTHVRAQPAATAVRERRRTRSETGHRPFSPARRAVGTNRHAQ
jgi:hypothetical protein